MPGIKFVGRNSQNNHTWTVKGEDCCDIYHKLCGLGVISTQDYDPVHKKMFEEAGCDYNKVMDEIIELTEENNLEWSEAFAKVCEEYNVEMLTDEQYMEVIQAEDGNAYYQSFTYVDDDVQYPGLEQNDLEFDDDGELIWEHDVKMEAFPANFKLSVGSSSVEIDTDSLEYDEDDIEDMVEEDIDRICEEMEFSGEHLFRSDWEKVHEELHTYYFNRL